MSEQTEPIAYTIPRASSTARIGITKLYELIGEGMLDARKAGRRTIIMVDSLHAYLAGLPRATVRAPRKRTASPD